MTEKKHYTDITILLDRSASMMPLRNAVVDSLNEQFAKMRETPGDTRWSMAQFDDPDSARGAKEQFPHPVFDQLPESQVGGLRHEEFKPRGSTALVDAVCLTIQKIDARVSGQDHIKPVVMIVTDGEENRSREFTSTVMREMVAARQERGWEFLFLAANQDAWAEAGKYNMQQTTVAHRYDYAGASVSDGALRRDACNAFDYEASARGIRGAIASGMIGCAHVVSGSAANWSSSHV